MSPASPSATLWSTDSADRWRRSLERYDDAIALLPMAKLRELDDWYRHELPTAMASRRAMHVTHAELERLTEWKMARGVWRAPNLVLVRGNTPEQVREASTAAFAATPHPTRPISTLAALAGVGPATASAVVAAGAPELYPFFDELVAQQVPTLGKVAWTLGYYARYATALRERAEQLSGETDGEPESAWTPAMVERALWAHAIVEGRRAS